MSAHDDNMFIFIQSLTILVRDWMHPTEKPYGFHGGQALIEQNLNLENAVNLTEEIRELRQDIRHRLFRSVHAFLMPHPGPIVAQGQFSGNLSGLPIAWDSVHWHIPFIFLLAIYKWNG
jgi:hypothetical protein